MFTLTESHADFHFPLLIRAPGCDRVFSCSLLAADTASRDMGALVLFLVVMFFMLGMEPKDRNILKKKFCNVLNMKMYLIDGVYCRCYTQRRTVSLLC